jgi:hypothetical protein
LGAHGVEHLRVNWSEDLDGECGVERLIVGLRGAFSDDPEMRLYRGGVRVDLDDGHFGAVVVDVLVECDQLGLVLLDELDEARDPPAFGVGASLDEVDALGIAVGKCLTALSADDSREVVAGAMIITAGLWPIANPAARVSAIFEGSETFDQLPPTAKLGTLGSADGRAPRSCSRTPVLHAAVGWRSQAASTVTSARLPART